MHRMDKVTGWLVSVICGLLFILASMAGLFGCVTKATLSLDETMADGSTFALHYAARGDGIVNQSVEYSGEGADPWRLAVNSDARIESPAQLALAAGAGELLAALPDIIEDLLPVLDVLNGSAVAETPGMMRGIIESLLRPRLEGLLSGLIGGDTEADE
jgi:hypothetical protein